MIYLAVFAGYRSGPGSYYTIKNPQAGQKVASIACDPLTRIPEFGEILLLGLNEPHCWPDDVQVIRITKEEAELLESAQNQEAYFNEDGDFVSAEEAGEGKAFQIFNKLKEKYTK